MSFRQFILFDKLSVFNSEHVTMLPGLHRVSSIFQSVQALTGDDELGDCP